jgi:outer membrane receptor protein involved in Fe transport
LYFAFQLLTKLIAMRKKLTPVVACFAALFSALSVYCQTGNISISGTIRSSVTKEIVPAASVVVKGGITGTFTDDKGNFRLGGSQKFPLTLVISSVGYETQEVSVSDPSAHIDVEMKPSSILGAEVVVAASRVPERIMESPVSIEQVTNANIRNSPASSYYDVIGNLKGVDMTTSSLTFKTPSTRGFNGSGNVRLNQIVDGMDNQAPGLNFSLGNVVGPSDIDVDHMELLEGASSALYGPGGMNGTLVINSKDPFKYQGLSAQVREGVMNINSPVRNASPYTDIAVRWAQKVNDRFAYKISGQYIEATDWVAYDSSNYSIPNAGYKQGGGGRNTDPAYDGVNLYGDEYNSQVPDMFTMATAISGYVEGQFIQGWEATHGGVPPTQMQIDQYMSSSVAAPYYLGLKNNVIPKQYVTRTGYREADIIDPKTKNLRLSGAAIYKINDHLIASVQANWATGNTVYTGSNRYSLKNLYMGQYKVELKSKNWFLRGYTTQENAGDAFNASVNTELLNEAWKPTASKDPNILPFCWLPQYVAQYAVARLNNVDDVTANNMARAFADQGRPLPGSARFNQIADSIAQLPIPKGGRFLDKSSLWMVEAQYNLTDILGLRDKGTDILIGANWKQYILNSQGTLFADSTGPIHINEYGAYAQVSQRLFGDVLKLSVSGRYDKNDNFDGQFTPRATAVIQVAKNHNFRISYQSAYRFPTTQNQYINLKIGGSTTLIGGLPSLRQFYNFGGNPPYTLASFQTFTVTGNPNDLVIQQFGKYKPESMNSFEVGYKGLMMDDRLLADVYLYFGKYMNLLTRITCVQSSNGTPLGLATPYIFSVSVNSPNSVNTDGWGASLEYLLDNNFYVSGNVFSDEIKNVPAGFKAYFNTPKYRSNIGFGNKGFGHLKRLGFNVIWRWQDSFYNESDFIQGNVPAFSTVDAQVSYKLTPIKSIIKLGATNLTNHYYINASGNPAIGGLYYVSFAYNVF